MPKNKPSAFVLMLAKFGAVCLGIIYVMIGVIALLSLMRLKDGGADESSILNLLDTIPLGNVIVGIILLGLAAFIFWKFYTAIVDPYNYGNDYKGFGKRIAIAVGGIAYGMIGYSAVQALLGLANSTNGTPTDQRLMVARIFNWWAGEWIIGILGAFIALTALAQFIYIFKKGFREKFELGKLSEGKRKIITTFAYTGHIARGIIMGIIAYFLILASIQSNPSKVVNTDKAFNFLGEHVNHVAFIVVAAGTICYGLYLFALSIYFDLDNDYN
jgi:hypothetical protein